MDLDSEVNAAPDIPEFVPKKYTKQNIFVLDFKKKATNTETTILQQYLQQWNKLQKFETPCLESMRNTFKYGDPFFY